jgi:hypothetical protein
MSRRLGVPEISALTVAGLLVVGALATLVGCGSSSHTGSSARTEIEAVVRRGFTTRDPALCAMAATPRYLNQNYGEHSDDPLADCRLDSVLPGLPGAQAVDFRSIRVSGDQAVVTVALAGGSGDGSVLRIELIRDAGRWKFNHTEDVQIDRARFDVASRKDLIAQGVRPEEAVCAVERVHRFYDTKALERAFISGKTEGLGAAEALCLGRRTLVKQLKVAIQKGAPSEIPDEIAQCIGRRLAKGSSTGLLRALIGAPDKLEDYFAGATKAAARACVKDSEAGLLPEASAS